MIPHAYGLVLANWVLEAGFREEKRSAAHGAVDLTFMRGYHGMRIRNGKMNGFSPERGSPVRLVFHVALAVLGWVLFVYFWRIVGERGLSAGALISLIAMVAFVAAVIVSTTLWIVHNVNIARTNRRKGGREVPELPYRQDKIGYTIENEDFESLKGERFIEVDIEGDRKIYRRVRRESATARMHSRYRS
jgi:hypothetical protein